MTFIKRAKLGAAVSVIAVVIGTVGTWACRAEDARQTAHEPIITEQYPEALPEGALARLGIVRLRHAGNYVGRVAFSPDGKVLASAGGDNFVRLWEASTGKMLRLLRGHEGIISIDFSPDGKLLASSGQKDGTIRLWDMASGREVRRMTPKEAPAYVRFSPNGKMLASGSWEKTIQLWEVATGRPLRHWEAHNGRTFQAAFSPDGRWLASSGWEDKSIRLWEVDTGRQVRQFGQGDTEMSAVTFSPDGKLVAGGGKDGVVYLWDVTTGKEVKRLTGHANFVQAVVFSKDGQKLFSCSYDKTVRMWNVSSGKQLHEPGRHSQLIYGISLSPDGTALASAGQDGMIYLWDTATGKDNRRADDYGWHSYVTYSAAGQRIAIAYFGGRIDLWDGKTGRFVRTLQKEGANVSQLAFNVDGKSLAVAGRAGAVGFLHIPSGKASPAWQQPPLQPQAFCDGLQFSPDGKLLCVNNYPGQIRVFEVASGKVLWKSARADGQVFSPDGTILLIAAGCNLIQFDAATGTKRSALRLNCNVRDSLRIPFTLAFSPDGRRLAVAASAGLVLCEPTGAETQQIMPIDFKGLRDEIAILRGGKRRNQIAALAFSPDGRWLAAAGSDTDVYLWEVATGKEMLQFRGHEAGVSYVAFSPDGQRVFSYGRDGLGYLWGVKPKRVPDRQPALTELWSDLAGMDAPKAFRAVWALSDDPRAADFLRKKLRPVARVDETRLAKLIDDLDDSSFEVRTAANKALGDLGELAAPAMERANENPSSLEKHERVNKLLARLRNGLSSTQVLQVRAVQALELAGTTDAREVLSAWANGAPGARLTQEAHAALARLGKNRIP